MLSGCDDVVLVFLSQEAGSAKSTCVRGTTHPRHEVSKQDFFCCCFPATASGSCILFCVLSTYSFSQCTIMLYVLWISFSNAFADGHTACLLLIYTLIAVLFACCSFFSAFFWEGGEFFSAFFFWGGEDKETWEAGTGEDG